MASRAVAEVTTPLLLLDGGLLSLNWPPSLDRGSPARQRRIDLCCHQIEVPRHWIDPHRCWIELCRCWIKLRFVARWALAREENTFGRLPALPSEERWGEQARLSEQ
jgi:hypothetical protein